MTVSDVVQTISQEENIDTDIAISILGFAKITINTAFPFLENKNSLSPDINPPFAIGSVGRTSDPIRG